MRRRPRRGSTLISLLAIVAICLASVSVHSSQPLPAEVDRWLRQVQIGPYQPAKVNWDEVYQAAKREGKVVVYTSSSRTISLKKEFETLYPGIVLEVYELGSTGSIEKVQREQQAKVYNADIIHASGYPAQLELLHRAHMIFPFYPPELESVIPKHFREPLVAQRYESRAIFYNTKVHSRPPITSWWDLTKPEWRGRLAMVDPVADASTLDLLTTIVLNADALAKDYERVFGRPIRLTTPNAGYELLKGIIENRPRMFARHTDLIKVVGDPASTNPPIGISIPFSSLSYAEDPARGGLKLGAITKLTPTIGLMYPSLMNMVYGAPNPNAAKLFIKYLYGDEKGGLGMRPFFVVGNWPARIDITADPVHEFLPGLKLPLKDLVAWYLDPSGVWNNSDKVQEWWMVNVK